MNQITSLFIELSLAAAHCAKSLDQSDFYNFAVEPSQIIWDTLLICFRNYRINHSHYGIPAIVISITALAFYLFYLEEWPVDPVPSLFKRKSILNTLLKAKKTILFSLLLLIIIQCTPDGSIIPFTKQIYISQFDAFISNVEFGKSSWQEKEWREADDNFKKYSRAYFNKFQNELTSDEKAHIRSLRLKYHACKGVSTINELGEGLEHLLLELENKVFEAIEDQ